MPQTNTKKPIGCIYTGDTNKHNSVYDNGGTLSFEYKCDITSHTDAEIIAAKKPLHITFTGYDETKTYKGMYVPIDEINTHVPAKIFLKEAHNVRDLIDTVQADLDNTKTDLANKANVSAIVPSAAVESSATASQSYAAGDYVVVNGVLRKVKSAIAKGDTISNSNSTATTVTGEFATITKWVYLYGSESTPKEYVRYRQNGKMVELRWNFTQETKQTWAAGNIPKPFRPSSSVTGACYRGGPNGPTNNVALYDVLAASGDVHFITLNAEAKGFLAGYCCWPIS